MVTPPSPAWERLKEAAEAMLTDWPGHSRHINEWPCYTRHANDLRSALQALSAERADETKVERVETDHFGNIPGALPLPAGVSDRCLTISQGWKFYAERPKPREEPKKEVVDRALGIAVKPAFGGPAFLAATYEAIADLERRLAKVEGGK